MRGGRCCRSGNELLCVISSDVTVRVIVQCMSRRAKAIRRPFERWVPWPAASAATVSGRVQYGDGDNNRRRSSFGHPRCRNIHVTTNIVERF